MSASFVYASAGRWRFNYTTASAWGIPPQNLIEPLAKIPHYAIKFIAMPPVFQMLSFFPIIFPTIFVFFFLEASVRKILGKILASYHLGRGPLPIPLINTTTTAQWPRSIRSLDKNRWAGWIKFGKARNELLRNISSLMIACWMVLCFYLKIQFLTFEKHTF